MKFLEKMKERVAKGKKISGWEEERTAYFESKEMRGKEVMEGEEEEE